MDNSGIISQYGFEYQKLVFIYYAIQINNMDSKCSFKNFLRPIRRVKIPRKFETAN